MRVLIVGCGYVGLPLGIELARQGHEVHGVRRSAEGAGEMQAAGLVPHAADVTRPEELRALPGPFDWVVHCVSSTRGGEAEYRQVYLEGTRNLIEWLAGSPIRKFVFTSSTSVYGQTDGSQVKETSLTDPESATSQILLQAEELLRRAATEQKFPAVIARVAGIYGPERGHLFQQFLRNEARIYGNGQRLINMIHRDDVVGAVITLLKNGKAGEVYNVVDDEPVTHLHFFRWLSETLGKWMPPAASEAEQLQKLSGKRGWTHKRVLNRKLRMELGYQFRYPTFRQGYTAEIQRLDQAGLLDIPLEPR